MARLVFRESIPRSSNNTVLYIPDLTYRDLILSKIFFETNDWFFEASIRSPAGELIRLSVSYFQHHQEVDLSGLRSKIEEGDRLELLIKPKQAPRNIDLTIVYTYEESLGAIYYQSQESLMNLGESSILSDICQGNRPTSLEIKCDQEIETVSFVPKFKADEEQPDISFSGDHTKIAKIDFTVPEFKDILPLLRFYQLKIVTGGDQEDGQGDGNLYFLARGFKC